MIDVAREKTLRSLVSVHITLCVMLAHKCACGSRAWEEG